MREEFYYNIRFKTGDRATKPIWVVPTSRAASPTATWSPGSASARTAAGGSAPPAGTSTTTGKHDNFRKLILNAIAWTAKVEVPRNGVEARFYSHDEIRTALSKPIACCC